MSDKTHTVTDVKKSRKLRLPSRKNALKWGSVAIFGTAVALVGFDKLNNRGSKTSHTVTTTEEIVES